MVYARTELYDIKSEQRSKIYGICTTSTFRIKLLQSEVQAEDVRQYAVENKKRGTSFLSSRQYSPYVYNFSHKILYSVGCNVLQCGLNLQSPPIHQFFIETFGKLVELVATKTWLCVDPTSYDCNRHKCFTSICRNV